MCVFCSVRSVFDHRAGGEPGTRARDPPPPPETAGAGARVPRQAGPPTPALNTGSVRVRPKAPPDTGVNAIPYHTPSHPAPIYSKIRSFVEATGSGPGPIPCGPQAHKERACKRVHMHRECPAVKGMNPAL